MLAASENSVPFLLIIASYFLPPPGFTFLSSARQCIYRANRPTLGGSSGRSSKKGPTSAQFATMFVARGRNRKYTSDRFLQLESTFVEARENAENSGAFVHRKIYSREINIPAAGRECRHRMQGKRDIAGRKYQPADLDDKNDEAWQVFPRRVISLGDTRILLPKKK